MEEYVHEDGIWGKTQLWRLAEGLALVAIFFRAPVAGLVAEMLEKQLPQVTDEADIRGLLPHLFRSRLASGNLLAELNGVRDSLKEEDEDLFPEQVANFREYLREHLMAQRV